MVFQKKGAAKGKQQTPAKPKNKKVVESEDLGDLDMDFDDDDSIDSESDEQQTPIVKTPKGKQVDKRVSFQIPGKNTPGNKTPKNEKIVGKKATPAKASSLQGFGGMLTSSAKNGKSKRPAEDDDDDDDDEDDDDEDDDADLDMLLGGGGDDDEEDDDEDDDDDDDDDEEDDDDDDEEEQSKKAQNSKQQSPLKSNVNKKETSFVQKTPVKKSEKTPVKSVEQSPKGLEKQAVKGKTPQKEAQQASVKTPKLEKKENAGIQKALRVEAEQRKERDARTLFMGNLPSDITVTELKALSADIVNVNIPKFHTKVPRRRLYAFLEFVNEAKADENMKTLKSKKLRGEAFKLDYAGEKRQNQQMNASSESKNLKKLFIPALPDDVTIDQIAKFFPKAYQISINTGFSQKHATAQFMEEKDAADALEACQSAKLGNKPIAVLYSHGMPKTQKRKKAKKGQANKKAKVEVSKVKSENVDDDDDDDDDDDEEDEE